MTRSRTAEKIAEAMAEANALFEAVAVYRARKGGGTKAPASTLGTRPKLPPLPTLGGPKWLAMSPAERERKAKHEARSWYVGTRKRYQEEGWLDDDTEGAIVARAQTLYRSLTGKGLPGEALQGPVVSPSDGEPPQHPEKPSAPSEATTEPPKARALTYYSNGKWRRGYKPGVLPKPTGEPELRKAGRTRPH